MGYLPQCKNDIFISYRHASNESNKWVDEFHKELRASLEERVGQVVIWRDSAEIRAGDQWRVEIDDALDTTAIFIAIVVKTYLESRVCTAELDRFLARTKNTGQGLQPIIIPIFKLLPKPERLPPELDAIHHHQFFQSDPYSEFVPGDDKTAHRFYEALSRLSLDLSIKLAKLRGDIRNYTAGKVFLAEVGPELYTDHEKLRSDLLQRGYWVVPEHPYLWHASDFDRKLLDDLEEADLCVHIVGRGASIEAESHEQAKVQLERAVMEMNRRGKRPPIVWIPPTRDTADQARGVIEFVEYDLANRGVEYWQGSLEDFKTQIYEQLAGPSPSLGLGKISEVALLVEEKDVGRTGQLNNLLVEAMGRDCRRIQFSGNVARDASAFAKALRTCEKCIIFWGTQSEEWLFDILASDTLAGHLGRDKLAIYVAMPATAEQLTFRTKKARTILAEPGGNLVDLRDFFQAGEFAHDAR